MLKHNEIENKMRENAARVKALEDKAERNGWKRWTAEDAAEIQRLQLENKILHDNARQALFAEVMPVIREAFTKYNGKPYGEKTSEKIKAEIKERTGCGVYISRSSYGGNSLEIVPLNADGFRSYNYSHQDFSVHPKYNSNAGGYMEFLTKENKINAENLDGLKLSSCAPYNEDIPGTIKALTKAFQAVQEARKVLDAAIGQFNDLKPSSVQYIQAASIRGYMF